ncbi:HET-domain-containing protein, partial [Colletotrichum eremochloae]
NLFRALLRLRRHGTSAEQVALWVDFICINQTDPHEKTIQLSNMVNIYRNASNVCIWLGESDNEGRSDKAMEFIPEIMDFAVMDRYARDKKQAHKWFALSELMRDRWFSRRWIVQEIALSKSATVHCGGSMVWWSDFADAVSLLVSNQESIKLLFDFPEWREGPNILGAVSSYGASILLEAMNNLFLRKPNGDLKRPIKTIEALVTQLTTFDTSDTHDLIYSVVSIASDTSHHVDMWARRPDPPLSFSLKTDYKKTPVEAYEDFTKFCVLSSQSLDIICRPWAMPVKKEDGNALELPSWIPLLSNSEFGVPDEVYSGRKNGEVLVGPVGYPHCRASGAKKNISAAEPGQHSHNSSTSFGGYPIEFPLGGGLIVAKGLRLATIKYVSPRTTGGVILSESLKMLGWIRFGTHTERVPDTIWRTLVADRGEHGEMPPSWYQRACLRCLEIADTFNNGDLNIGELLQGQSQMLHKYLVRVRNVTWNRRFFRAATKSPSQERWDYGLCPPDSRKDDLICILFGCSVPVILRKAPDGCMTLVGEVYVHGKMDGEAVEEFEENSSSDRLETFSLR